MDILNLRSTQKWLQIYHILSAILTFIGLLLLGIIIFLGASNSLNFDTNFEYNLFIMVMLGTIAFMFIGLLISIYAAISVRKKGKFNWVLQLVLVAFGFSSMVTIIPCIFLFIGLVSQESKDYYLK